jgi:hypothetical protein
MTKASASLIRPVVDIWNRQTCTVCQCTDDNCSKCIKRTGMACHWVGRNLCSACTDLEHPWGFEIKIECYPGLREQTFFKQGTKSKVTRWAKMKSGFYRINEMKPITKQAWHGAFGHGDQRM